MKVILINKELGHGPSRRLCGKSGKFYGNSRYSTEHRCQIVEMTLEAFAAASEDIWRASNMVMRRWWPTFVQEAATVIPAPVMEFHAGYNLAMDGRGLPDEASPAATLGWGYAHGKASPLEPEIPEPDLGDEPETMPEQFAEEPDKFPMADTPLSTAINLDRNQISLTLEFKGLKWFAACKLARTKYGIDTKGLSGIDSLIAAILLKLGHGQQPAKL